MSTYQVFWPIIRCLPPEFAHKAALALLRLPLRWNDAVLDPFEWNGFRCRNRVGIAAGFDKNAAVVPGVERLGAGFVEVGTILVEPWPGNQVSPRMRRLVTQRAIWNRLGFTSDGVLQVKRNLGPVSRHSLGGMVVLCNIGPHPGRLRQAGDPLAATRDDLLQLVEALLPFADAFVVNLSSPNTRGLRSLLQSDRLNDVVMRPLVERLRQAEAAEGQGRRRPLLLKLPPEDADRRPWARDDLARVICPLIEPSWCDGLVAVNTSSRLATELVSFPPADLPGGISGEPLRPEALRVVSLVRKLVGPKPLLIGCGGMMQPSDAISFLDAGADLVETYTGMVYGGPGLIVECARAIRDHRPRARLEPA
ncbi:MAG: dihydroorotate dehydrogenase 2 [Gemmataceae bacterium]|nr:dihydroorotate dehydrogenase 2 [Gemmataceae bacterium]